MLLCGTLCLSAPSTAQAPTAPAPDSVAPQSTDQASQPAGAPTGAASPKAPTSAAPPRRAQSIYRHHTLDDRVKELSKALDLNETQQAGVKAVLERQQLQARQIQFDQSLTGSERIGRFRALQEETVLRIRSLLNDDQKKKYDPLSHSTQSPDSSQKYVDQWVRSPQHK